MIPYLTRNGPNILYIVTVQETGSSNITATTVTQTTAVIGGLRSLTTYNITITAGNNVGNAIMSSMIFQFTTAAMRKSPSIH